MEVLGFADVFAASRRRIASLIDGARGLTRRVSQGTMRGASLVALKAKRESLTLTGGIFLGDVFEYLRRGQGGPDQLGTIARHVGNHLLAAFRVARRRANLSSWSATRSGGSSPTT